MSLAFVRHLLTLICHISSHVLWKKIVILKKKKKIRINLYSSSTVSINMKDGAEWDKFDFTTVNKIGNKIWGQEWRHWDDLGLCFAAVCCVFYICKIKQIIAKLLQKWYRDSEIIFWWPNLQATGQPKFENYIPLNLLLVDETAWMCLKCSVPSFHILHSHQNI
jgi:hypothetical protein